MCKRQARIGELAIEEYCACAALPATADEFRAGEVQPLANRREQPFVVRHIDRPRQSVYRQLHNAHAPPPRMATGSTSPTTLRSIILALHPTFAGTECPT